MTRLTIKRPTPDGDGVVIGAITSNGAVTLYPSRVATQAELNDMQRARDNLFDMPNHSALVVKWLKARGYDVEAKR